MAHLGLSTDDLEFDFESRHQAYDRGQQWSMAMMNTNRLDLRRSIAPLQTAEDGLRQTTMSEHPMMSHWHYSNAQQPVPYQTHHQALEVQYENAYHNLSLQTSSAELAVVSQAPLHNSIPINQPYFSMSAGIEGMPQNWSDFQTELVHYTTIDAGLPVSPYPQHSSSPTGSHLESISQLSSSDESSWTVIEQRHSMEPYERPAFVNPSQTVHTRTLSDSSYSDVESSTRTAFTGGIEMLSNHAVCSPISLSDGEYDYGHIQPQQFIEPASHPSSSSTSTSLVRPISIPIKKSSSPTRSSGSQSSIGSPTRKVSRKSPLGKATEKVIKKTTIAAKVEGEKRIGRRKGPLRPDQRKQASEIRKVGACLRCKFLKKTCDKGEPCAGCQPSHARLWQVPCTRIDIKEIGYFLKDWKFDYERHVTLGFSVGNIKGFSDTEKTLFITHGYGHMLPITAREVYVRDENCLNIDWTESWNRPPQNYEIATAKLSAGMEGISTAMLSDYLDRHIDGGFEKWVDDYFEGTPFLSQMLKTAYRFYFRTDSKIIKKALKLVLAYNLTLHITMVEGVPDEENLAGRIDDETSKFFGKTMAPVMINFQIKCAMADMWRELHKDVLEELSSLYSSVYSGEKLKNWPTIFILASVLLAVWECMQFDCHYRVPDEAAIDKFCNDMETTPVGVIVGLFQAISQKLPSFLEWDTSKHHALLGSNIDVCNTMTEVRDHVASHGKLSRFHV